MTWRRIKKFETFGEHVEHSSILDGEKLKADGHAVEAARPVVDRTVREYAPSLDPSDVQILEQELPNQHGCAMGWGEFWSCKTAKGKMRLEVNDLDGAAIVLDPRTWKQFSVEVFNAIVRHEVAHVIEWVRHEAHHGENSDVFMSICAEVDAAHPKMQNEPSEMWRHEERGLGILGQLA